MTEKEQLLLQMYASSRKKKIIIISAILVLLILVGLGFGFFVVSSYSFELKQNEVVVEYGETYNPVIDDFVSFNDEITKDNTSFECNIKNIDGKEYADIGEYDVNISHIATYSIKGKKLFNRTIKKVAKVVVKDTTAPVFTKDCPKKLDVMQTNEDKGAEDISKYFTADDLSGSCTISISDDAYDIKTAGEYTVEVTATDKSQNKATMKCVVNVYMPELSLNKYNIELIVGESDKLEIKYKGSEKPKFINSDDTIVSIDENGKIKALLEGSCNITVTCNGMKEVCNVVVKPKPVEQTTVKETTTAQATTTTQPSTTSSSSGSTSTTKQKKTTTKSKSNNKKYPNKDFLFKDGYTMENVTEAATAYLKASGRSGSCIPLKNKDGIYIGMRVVFDD